MILEEIADYTRVRVSEEKKAMPLSEIRSMAEAMDANTEFPFEKALKQKDIAFICEVKKASPSKGVIAPDFPYLDIAKDYEASGANAISCLTEPKWFQGSAKYLEDIAKTVKIPVLRKDFTVDSFQIFEAKVLGASCVLLICELLDLETLKEYKAIADSLGLSCLVESHTEAELLKALDAGARICGVNNRDLKTFKVDINTSANLRSLVPADRIFVSESGIKTSEDIKRLRANGTDAVLIGETLMRSPDKKSILNDLRCV